MSATLSLPSLNALEDGRQICSECGERFWKDGNTLTCGPECAQRRRTRLAREKRVEKRTVDGVDPLSSVPEGWRCPCCQEAAALGRWFCSDRCFNAFKNAVVARMAESFWGLA